MNARHLEIVRANSEAFARRDVEGMLALFAPDAVVFDRRPLGWSEYSGHTALRAYYQGLFDNAESLREDLEVVEQRDGMVIASCVLTAVLAGAADAGEVPFRYALAITLRDDRIQQLEIYADAATALADKGPA